MHESRVRTTVVGTKGADARASLAEDVARGLTSEPKSLSCRYLYDAEGSRLFEAICALPEYYLTRAEASILATHAGELAERLDARPDVVELGAGSAAKTRLLLSALLARHSELLYEPIDISAEALERSARELVAEHEGLHVHAIAAEYDDGLATLEDTRRPRLVLWLGSSIGNLHREDAAAFLRSLAGSLAPEDALLVGIDLRKERAILEAAYDDSLGVTAAFNKNLLARIDRELGADFALDAFEHRARYDEEAGRVELYLDSLRDQLVTIRALPLEVRFARGEPIHTENSYKYSFGEIDTLARAAGLVQEVRWLDAEERFSVNLLRPEAS